MKELDNPAATMTVMNVMGAYTRGMDKHDLDGVLELFTDDCVIDYGDFGYHEGKGELEEFLVDHMEAESGTLDAVHLAMNPNVHVDGDEATGQWHYLGMNVIEGIGATWLVGFYDVDFVRQDGDWLIDELAYDAKYASPYDDGWAETPNAF